MKVCAAILALATSAFLAGPIAQLSPAHAASDLTLADQAEDGTHRLALQISDGSPEKMAEVLNVAANVSRYYSGIGDLIDIRIVAFADGLDMLRTDKSPVLERLKAFSQSMPNVTFLACGNTIDTVTRTEGKTPPLIDGAEVVEAGVVTLIELHEKGWTIVRP